MTSEQIEGLPQTPSPGWTPAVDSKQLVSFNITELAKQFIFLSELLFSHFVWLASVVKFSLDGKSNDNFNFESFLQRPNWYQILIDGSPSCNVAGKHVHKLLL